jgi:hypothetical protein
MPSIILTVKSLALVTRFKWFLPLKLWYSFIRRIMMKLDLREKVLDVAAFEAAEDVAEQALADQIAVQALADLIAQQHAQA